jgi:hypothetical protein
MRNHLLTLAMLLGSLLILGCPGGRGGGGGGGSDDDDSGPADDDDVVDDDDVADDDDDAVDDDDVATGCEGETEPNDDPAAPNDVGTQTGSFCIDGEILCGNDGEAFTEDLDHVVFTAGSGGTVDFRLEWDGANTDMDGIVGDETAGSVAHDFEMGFEAETGSFPVTAGSVYSLRVGCWEGQGGTWTATFDF